MTEFENTKWKTEETIRCGLKIHELAATTYREDIQPRVGAATIDGLRTDVDELRNTAAGAVASRADSRASTLDQDSALRSGARVVSAMRNAIRQVHPKDRSLQGDFGVGLPILARSVASVVGGLRIVIDAASRHPDAVRAAGILDQDTRMAQDALAILAAADATQEGRKLSAREATARRRATQLRVQAGISKIVAAAHLAFVDRPGILEKFTSLLPSRPRRSRSTAPTSTPPTPSPISPV